MDETEKDRAIKLFPGEQYKADYRERFSPPHSVIITNNSKVAKVFIGPAWAGEGLHVWIEDPKKEGSL